MKNVGCTENDKSKIDKLKNAVPKILNHRLSCTLTLKNIIYINIHLIEIYC